MGNAVFTSDSEPPARRTDRLLKILHSFTAILFVILFFQFWILTISPSEVAASVLVARSSHFETNVDTEFRGSLPLRNEGGKPDIVSARNERLTLLTQHSSNVSPSTLKLSQFHHDRFEAGLQKCAGFDAPPISYPTAGRKNSRWNLVIGQNRTLALRNATLFDGDAILKSSVDIIFSNGVISNVGTDLVIPSGAEIFNLDGKWVTPGLVDMHSHHLVRTWPNFSGTDDTNELNDAFSGLTPFVRSLDSIKPYDVATTWIRSGGVTSSLILPGSGNIMGGEAYIVKNVLRSGRNGEETVEEMLLDHGLPKSERRRYMKMACGMLNSLTIS